MTNGRADVARAWTFLEFVVRAPLRDVRSSDPNARPFHRGNSKTLTAEGTRFPQGEFFR